MKTEVLTKSKIELNEQILFSRPVNALAICRITEVREKAVKVDYVVESIHHNGIPVFTYCCWIPISVITWDKYGCLTVKNWYARKFEGGVHIKKYYIGSEGQKCFINS